VLLNERRDRLEPSFRRQHVMQLRTARSSGVEGLGHRVILRREQNELYRRRMELASGMDTPPA
jgi:hypothetical protein